MERFDVVVIGASYAGRTAANNLARYGRAVLLLDGGPPRNRKTSDEDSVLAELHQAAFPTLIRIPEKAIQARGSNGDFRITTESGRVVIASKIVLAMGVEDCLDLSIKNLEILWGSFVFNCPSCIKTRVNYRSVILVQMGSLEHCIALAEKVIDVARSCLMILEDQDFKETDPRISIVCGKVIEVEADSVECKVSLQDGRCVQGEILLIANKSQIASRHLCERLGCQISSYFNGEKIDTSPSSKEALGAPGVYPIGDLAMEDHQISFACSDAFSSAIYCNMALKKLQG